MPPKPCRLRLVPDEEIAGGWWRSGGAKKLAPKEKRAMKKPKTPKGKLFKLDLDFNRSCAILQSEPIYAWGWNSSGQLGLGHTLDKAAPHSPLAVLAGPSQYIPTVTKGVKLVACGARYTVVATNEGEVLVTGRYSVGQLGLPTENFDTRGFIATPMTVLAIPAPCHGPRPAPSGLGWARITHLACGSAHTLVCRSSSPVADGGGGGGGAGAGAGAGGGCGGGGGGALARSSFDGEEEGEEGKEWTLGDEVGDELLAFGLNHDGQLGLGHREDQTKPRLVRGLAGERIALVVCGGGHSIVVSTSGVMFAWGDNRAGQLGLGDREGRPTPTALPPVESWASGDAGVEGRPGLRPAITAVAAGLLHTVVGTRGGLLWGFGSSCDGQLGMGELIGRTSPTLIVTMDELRSPADVTEGDDLVMGPVDGPVFGGAPPLQDMDHSASEEAQESQRAKLAARRAAWAVQRDALAAEDFWQLAAGESHTVVVARGRLFSFGGNRHGQLGLGEGHYAPSCLPTIVPSDEVSRWPVLKLACGRCHTVCMNHANECYLWGDNEYGQLGTGEATSEGIGAPMFQDDLLWEDDVLHIAGMQHSCHTVIYRKTDGKSQAALDAEEEERRRAQDVAEAGEEAPEDPDNW